MTTNGQRNKSYLSSWLGNVPGMHSNLHSGDAFFQHCKMIEPFCPFLKPSRRANLLSQYAYDLPDGDLEVLRELVFYLSVVQTETFRSRRRELPTPDRHLLSDNLIFVLPDKGESSSIDGERLLVWPHYLLKVLYTNVGIMFGKFWKNEERISRQGVDIPPPPCHFLAIRSAVKTKDPYFFSKVPSLVDDLSESIDDGRNVHSRVGVAACDVSSLTSMLDYDYYARVKEWAKRRLDDGVEVVVP